MLKRLDHRDTQNSLGAEVELALLWAMSQVADLEVEPEIDGSSKRPDAYSRSLFSSLPAVIEITSLSDDSFSGKDIMDRAANIMVAFADRVRNGAGQHLHFEFKDESYWENHRLHRKPCVSRDFELTPFIENALKAWLSRSLPPDPRGIRINDGSVDVVIKWRDYKVLSIGRTFCRAPPIAYHLEDNPIYKALKAKRDRQLTKISNGTLKGILLVDVGCYLLRTLKFPLAFPCISADAIIRHSLARLDLDVVCVFSPTRPLEYLLTIAGVHSKPRWSVSCYDKRNELPPTEYVRLERMAGLLPKPRYEGYQARELHAQGAFAPQGRGRYLGTRITSYSITSYTGASMTIKISTRLLQEYLAGRIDFNPIY